MSLSERHRILEKNERSGVAQAQIGRVVHDLLSGAQFLTRDFIPLLLRRANLAEGERDIGRKLHSGSMEGTSVGFGELDLVKGHLQLLGGIGVLDFEAAEGLSDA